MFTIRPCSESAQRITRVTSLATPSISQFCFGKGPEGLLHGATVNTSLLWRYHLKGPLHHHTRSYHGPKESQKPIANDCRPTASFSGISGTGLSSQSARVGHTAAMSPGLDLARLSKDYPDPNLWYVLTAITLTTVGRQHLIGQLWEHLAAAPNHEEVRQGRKQEPTPQGSTELSPEMETEVIRLEQVAMRLREGLMKMSVLFGYPRAINALSSLHKSQKQLSVTSTPRAVLHSTVFSRLSRAPPLRPYLRNTDEAPVNNYTRGLALFTKIYSPKHVTNLLHNMSVSSAGDLSNFAVSRIYGDLLSDVLILNERETGLACFVTCLALALCTGPEEHDLAGQIKGHMYGARNLGASGVEIRGAADLAIRVWQDVTEGSFQDALDPVRLVLEKAKAW